MEFDLWRTEKLCWGSGVTINKLSHRYDLNSPLTRKPLAQMVVAKGFQSQIRDNGFSSFFAGHPLFSRYGSGQHAWQTHGGQYTSGRDPQRP